MIEENNTRMTSQRIKILEFLRSVKTHPTAEDIFINVKKELPAITLATVYRNLNLLAEQGRILKLEINNEFRFDADMCAHQHWVCRQCGKIGDIFKKEISDYALRKAKPYGFDIECVTIIYNGTCQKCGGS